MKKLTLIISIIILPISVFASDVYYCSDDAITGFDSKKNSKQQNYITSKFKIMIDFKNGNILSDDIFFTKDNGKCVIDDISKENILYCISNVGSAFSINKTNLKFIRSFMFNVKERPDDLIIGYGTCQKF